MGFFGNLINIIRGWWGGGGVNPPPPPANPGVNQALLILVNNARVVNGKPPLRPNVALDAAAMRNSADMARYGRLFHTGTDGTRPQDRILQAGYVAAATGECVDMNNSAWSAVEAWVGDPPHRAILLGDYDDAGFGVVGDFWTADLASQVKRFGEVTIAHAVGRPDEV